MKSGVKTTHVQQAVKAYANPFTLVNVQPTGERGLSYVQFQKHRLNPRNLWTGPTERTPKPEYLIAPATYLGVRW